jgi:hypothetical protein
MVPILIDTWKGDSRPRLKFAGSNSPPQRGHFQPKAITRRDPECLLSTLQTLPDLAQVTGTSLALVAPSSRFTKSITAKLRSKGSDRSKGGGPIKIVNLRAGFKTGVRSDDVP